MRVAKERAAEAVLFADPGSESLKSLGASLEVLLRVAFLDGAMWERVRAGKSALKVRRAQASNK